MLSRHDSCNEFMIGHRNSAMAAKAWYREQGHYQNHPFLDSFRDGFIAGYIDVAEGGNGCVPAICPPKYWGWQYQSADGQRACNAWFEGFPMGAKAAEEDGVGHWGHIRPFGSRGSTHTADSHKAGGHPPGKDFETIVGPTDPSSVRPWDGISGDGERIVPGSVFETERIPSPDGRQPDGQQPGAQQPGGETPPGAEDAPAADEAPFDFNELLPPGAAIQNGAGTSRLGSIPASERSSDTTDDQSGLSFRFE